METSDEEDPRRQISEPGPWRDERPEADREGCFRTAKGMERLEDSC